MSITAADTLYYFTEGQPTTEDINKASKFAKKVQFLDVRIFDVNRQNSKIKFVAGCVPETYSDRVIVDAVKAETPKPESKKTEKQ